MYIDANAAHLRHNLRAYLDHVAATGDRVLILRHGKELAALVPVSDFNALEKVSNSREDYLNARHESRMKEFRIMKAVMEGEDR